MGASGFGYELAKRFGHGIATTRAGLVPLVFSADDLVRYKDLSGVVCRCKSSVAGKVLPTRCCSPIVASAARRFCKSRPIGSRGDDLTINFLPSTDAADWLKGTRSRATGRGIENRARRIPTETLGAAVVRHRTGQPAAAPIFRARHAGDLRAIAKLVLSAEAKPKAIVPRRSPSAASTPTSSHRLRWSRRSLPAFYFIGEVVDVTGHLGGFNFQWAWSSGERRVRWCRLHRKIDLPRIKERASCTFTMSICDAPSERRSRWRYRSERP